MKRTRWLLAAGALTLLAMLASATSAKAGCGEEFRSAPAHSNIAGGPPLAIGDSVLADAVPLLARDGFQADGMVCRQMGQGIEILRQRAGGLPHLIVLALGTNGEVTPQQIDSALAILGPRRVLALVTPHGSVVASTPTVIRAAAESHPGRVLLLDWDRLAASHRDWFAPDGVHLGGAAGIEGFAGLVTSVLPVAASGGPGILPAPATTQPQAQTPGEPVTIQPLPEHGTPAIPHHTQAPARPGAQQPSSTNYANSGLPAATNRAPGTSKSAATHQASSRPRLIVWAALTVALLAIAALLWQARARRGSPAPPDVS